MFFPYWRCENKDVGIQAIAGTFFFFSLKKISNLAALDLYFRIYLWHQFIKHLLCAWLYIRNFTCDSQVSCDSHIMSVKQDFKISLHRRGELGSGRPRASFNVLQRSGGARSWGALIFRLYIHEPSTAPKLSIFPTSFGAHIQVWERSPGEVDTLMVSPCWRCSKWRRLEPLVMVEYYSVS